MAHVGCPLFRLRKGLFCRSRVRVVEGTGKARRLVSAGAGDNGKERLFGCQCASKSASPLRLPFAERAMGPRRRVALEALSGLRPGRLGPIYLARE